MIGLLVATGSFKVVGEVLGFYALLIGLLVATLLWWLIVGYYLFLCPLDRAARSDQSVQLVDIDGRMFLCPLDRAARSDVSDSAGSALMSAFLCPLDRAARSDARYTLPRNPRNSFLCPLDRAARSDDRQYPDGGYYLCFYALLIGLLVATDPATDGP